MRLNPDLLSFSPLLHRLPIRAAAGGTNDELNIAVIDHDGKWTGNKLEVLELYPGVSKATDAVDFHNKLFYKEQINDRSNYVAKLRANLTGINAGDNDKTTTFTQVTSAYINTESEDLQEFLLMLYQQVIVVEFLH